MASICSASDFRTWNRLRKVALKKKVRPLEFHCTRHTFITWALEAGTPAKRVSEWVGATVEVIERHYAHAIPEVYKMDFLDGTRTSQDSTQRKDGVS